MRYDFEEFGRVWSKDQVVRLLETTFGGRISFHVVSNLMSDELTPFHTLQANDNATSVPRRHRRIFFEIVHLARHPSKPVLPQTLLQQRPPGAFRARGEE